MKAIETKYKGYRFRSRLEARWAVFFDALGIEWEYELEGFQFDNGIRYLPDFYLPDLDLWVEIKGQPPTASEVDKARRLALEGDKAVVVWWGAPKVDWPGRRGFLFAWNCKGFTEKLGVGLFCRAEIGLSLDTENWGEHLSTDSGFSKKTLFVPGPTNKVGGDLFAETQKAVVAASSARFEYGENGVSPSQIRSASA